MKRTMIVVCAVTAGLLGTGPATGANVSCPVYKAAPREWYDVSVNENTTCATGKVVAKAIYQRKNPRRTTVGRFVCRAQSLEAAQRWRCVDGVRRVTIFQGVF
jgi:hypothetical protein